MEEEKKVWFNSEAIRDFCGGFYGSKQGTPEHMLYMFPTVLYKAITVKHYWADDRHCNTIRKEKYAMLVKVLEVIGLSDLIVQNIKGERELSSKDIDDIVKNLYFDDRLKETYYCLLTCTKLRLEKVLDMFKELQRDTDYGSRAVMTYSREEINDMVNLLSKLNKFTKIDDSELF